MNFQSISDCSIPKFKLKYDDLENIKADCVNTVLFILLLGTPSISDSEVSQKICELSRRVDEHYQGCKVLTCVSE